MTKVLKNAASFTKPYFFNPFNWYIDIHCDDPIFNSITGNGGCSTPQFPKQTAAYTLQENSALSKYPIITFCPIFFDQLKTCQDRVNRYGNSPLPKFKLDLTNYQCQGYAALHEIFHLDWESRVGGQGHIADKAMPIKSEYDGNIVNVKVYGPEFTKILAQYDSNDVGKFVSTNADNLAQYSLARWVTKKIGAYPHSPRSGLQPAGDPWDGKLKYAIQDGQLTLLNGSSFGNDSNDDPSTFQYDAEGDPMCTDENGDNTGCSSPEDVISITKIMTTYVADEPTIPTEPATTTQPITTTQAASKPTVTCNDSSLEDGDGLCTCYISTTMIFTTFTPGGGPGASCGISTIEPPAQRRAAYTTLT
jgi:hypothetical protein